MDEQSAENAPCGEPAGHDKHLCYSSRDGYWWCNGQPSAPPESRAT